MKLLKRMLLIKWYYIEHEIINFDSVNFMTGKNGSGKSTIIDALQIVMLGDTRGTFFNKAANDKGGRTLDGYLKGEFSDDGDVGFKSKRSGRFTSYIATEFLDTVERKYFTCGIVFDSYKDAPTDHMFFILNDKIPENHFIDEETNTPMDYKKLKTYFAKNYGTSRFSTFKESNKSYQNEFLAKMGALKPKFFNLFKKSVTFTPIDDIEKFISEYVCDVTNEIDIEKMKENIRHYKQLEKEALSMQERQEELQKIENLYNLYKTDKDKEQIQRYLLDKSNLEMNVNELNKTYKQFEDNNQRISNLQKEKEDLENKIKDLSKIQDEKKEEKGASDINQKQQNLEKKINEINSKLQSVENKTKDLIIKFRNKISKWRININQFIQEKNNVENPHIIEIATNLKDNIEYLLSINEENISEFDEGVLQQIKSEMTEINGFANQIFYKMEEEQNQILAENQSLEKEIQSLNAGVKPYKANLIEFKTRLEAELEQKFNEKIQVNILADLLEIKDFKWKEAIECYLNSQMFYFIIEPKYFYEASNIYRNIAKDGKYYGFGLVDIENIQKLNIIPEQNSLAEEIETENSFARTYINYLLGRVIKCDSTSELRKHKTAITADCMLYKNYVLRKLADKYNEFKFIGKKSIIEQIKLKQEKYEENKQKLDNIQNIKNISKELKNAEIFSDDEIRYEKEDIIFIRQKNEFVIEKEKYQKELDSLDLTWLDKINREIADLEIQITELRNQNSSKGNEQARLEEKNENIKNEKIPNFESNILHKKQEIEAKYKQEWITNIGEPEFEKEKTSKKLSVINKTAEELIAKYSSQKYAKFNTLREVRKAYTTKYQFGYDYANENSNTEFSEDLQKIANVQLPQYIDKIRDSKDKAYEQFREEFISKLKANIDEVESQVEELNDALKSSTFGVDKYQFKVKPKQEYRRFYDMITDPMLMEGQNLWSEAFNSKYHEEIDELFRKLTSSDISEETYNKNISIYTDYKTYLSFDLIVTDKDGVTQHLSRTLDKKSGGETQTPFYISVLASFAQLYRINKNRNDNTLRLIVFDEAFNKMDEERMKESLKLLPKFGFQAIIAAPSEKAGEIIPLVPNTLCVIKKGRDTVVTEWEKGKSLYEL